MKCLEASSCFLMLFGITTVLIDVNAAQSKLVLLENFNENYSKCLRLLYKVNAAEGVNAASEEVSTAELVSTAYEVILFYNGLDVLTRQILDSKGSIPTKTVGDANIAIQEMVEYSQKWHNKTSSKARRPHNTKDCPLKEEGNTLEEAYYTQFGAPYQPGG
ncbi:hypothetical protein Tco_1028855 [Tanacetum coccineum]|uniref:Variant surface glycoprotein n=1 Tax=Tanacetum coccineum TaxID=301880 RepID=A0ABQ5G298_9ASTR